MLHCIKSVRIRSPSGPLFLYEDECIERFLYLHINVPLSKMRRKCNNLTKVTGIWVSWRE